jgi:hypothetical protein
VFQVNFMKKPYKHRRIQLFVRRLLGDGAGRCGTTHVCLGECLHFVGAYKLLGMAISPCFVLDPGMIRYR